MLNSARINEPLPLPEWYGVLKNTHSPYAFPQGRLFFATMTHPNFKLSKVTFVSNSTSPFLPALWAGKAQTNRVFCGFTAAKHPVCNNNERAVIIPKIFISEFVILALPLTRLPWGKLNWVV
jgi:hypothetical protein